MANHLGALKAHLTAHPDFQRWEREAHREGRIKTYSVLGLWLLSYGLYLTCAAQFSNWGMAPLGLANVTYTVMTTILMFAVMHDGSHNASSFSKRANAYWSRVMTICGGSSVLWYHQHCVAHHMHTNTPGRDYDIEGNGLMRLHAEDPLLPRHKYQQFYAWALYCMAIFMWVFVSDFLDMKSNKHRLSPAARRAAWKEILVFKPIALGLFWFLPAWLVGSFWLGVGLYLAHIFLMGFLLAIVFQMAHTSDTKLMGSKALEDERDWVARQTETTTNFATKNPFLTWALGGLNFQIEHHLFPDWGHTMYPKIAPSVKEYCEANGLSYHESPTFGRALRGHFDYLKRLGRETRILGYEDLSKNVI